MKKLYIVCIDYKASYKPMFTEYKVLEAESLLDAMSEAEQYLDKDKVYLLNINQALTSGRKVKGLPGTKEIACVDILTNRGNGWHRTDAAHSEIPWQHIFWVDAEKNAELIDCKEAAQIA